jgi:hypothetical protein
MLPSPMPLPMPLCQRQSALVLQRSMFWLLQHSGPKSGSVPLLPLLPSLPLPSVVLPQYPVMMPLPHGSASGTSPDPEVFVGVIGVHSHPISAIASVAHCSAVVARKQDAGTSPGPSPSSRSSQVTTSVQ